MLGDDSVSPPALELLKSVLERRAGPQLAGKTVHVNWLMVRIEVPNANVNERQFGTAVQSTPGGAVGAPFAFLLIQGIEGSKSSKTVLVEVDGLVDGRNFHAYSEDSYRGRVTEGNLRETMLSALEKAATQARQAAEAR